MLKCFVNGGEKDKGQELCMGKFAGGRQHMIMSLTMALWAGFQDGTFMSWLFLEKVREMLLRAGIVVDSVHIGQIKMVYDLN